MNLGNAFKNFFEGQQTGRAVGYPRFKAKKRDKPSFYLANDKFRLGDHWVDIPKLGRVNMAEKLRFEGKILSGTVSKEASWWFLSVTVDLPDRPTVAAEAAVGIDLGINRLATLSDGTGYENQRPLRRLLKRVKRASRDLSRKQPGSRSREKARDKLARLHYRIRCIRDDLLHKLTTDIARRYGLVGLETLNIKGMVKNHALAQALTDAALGRLGDLLESKVAAAGGEVQKVDRFFPSSKRCHRCHALHEHLPLGDRVFVCPNPKCGLVCDRDLNASLNLLEEASRLSQVALTA
jgi:putative transposase